MPSVLFIASHRFNRSPSQRYRFEQYLNYFESQGFHVSLSATLSAEDDIILYGKSNVLKKIYIILKSVFIRIKDLNRAHHFDIIFIQREALLIGSSFFEKHFYKKTKVVFDFDDSIWLLDTSPENKKYDFLKNPNKTKINIANAHAVIAGNSYLADYAKQFNSNTWVIPTTINTDYHKPEPKTKHHDKIVIGWSGSITTIKHFEMMIPVLKAIQKKFPNRVEIQVIGQANYANPELIIVSKVWDAKTEVEDLNCFDIGIMPLPDNEWAKGKCGLKGLSYMACGIPTIMSSVGVNCDIIQNGINGFLANNHEEWNYYLSELIEKPELRAKIGSNGRETVVKNYSVNAHKQRYLEVLKSLIK